MKAQPGDILTVTYTGTIAGGEVFESTADSEPLEFTIGDGSVMPAFEEQLIGMGEGESKTFTLAPEQAYGPVNQELIHTVKRRLLPDQENLRVGMVLALNAEHNGQTVKVPATLTALDGDMATVDFNHPLAGQALTYAVTIDAIRRPAAAS